MRLNRNRRSNNRIFGSAVVMTLGVLVGVAPACETDLTTERVASGLARPVVVTAPPGDFDRVFIVEQRSGSTGRIRILQLADNTLLPTPFLSIPGLATGSEQGLLGLAFHPNYAANGYFYVNYTISGGTTYIRRYQVSGLDPDIADASSGFTILSVSQPFSNHNGGWLDFGPDGYLYIGLGDGGSAGDPGNRAQDITSQFLGKMLRIDVDGDDFPADAGANYAIPPGNPFVGLTGDDEIWAYGLRNPWRCSFDRETGDLYIGDVGQNAWEEIDFQSAASAGGENYGWRCYEGNAPYSTGGCAAPSSMVFPIHVYSHSQGCSVTGGYVYRGAKIWDLRGTYFFADYCSNKIWTFRYDGASQTDFRDRTAQLAPGGGLSIGGISSFGEDAKGELYICDLSGGEVFKVVPSGPVVGDMNGDGAINAFDIDPFVLALADPVAYGEQFVGIDPDVTGDINCDGALNAFDIDPFVSVVTGG